MRAVIFVTLVLVILAGCGPMPEEAAPTTTPEMSGDSTPATATPPGAILTFGNLATRINAAWDDVESYRITFRGAAIPPPVAPASPVASPMASPVASPVATPAATPGATPVSRAPAAYVTVREVVLPDLQRQVVDGLGARDHEVVATPDGIYIRGPMAEQIAPGTPEDAWIEIDPAEIPENSTLSVMLGGIPQTPPTPLSTAPQRLWPQQLRDLGAVEFDGRDCHVYGAADTVAATGMRVDYAIAVDEAGVPCYIETSAAGTVQRLDEYTNIGDDLAIEPPTGATPVSVLPELAEPAVHD